MSLFVFLLLIPSACYGLMPPRTVQTRIKMQASNSPESEAKALFDKKHGKAKPGTFFYVEESRIKSTFDQLGQVYGVDVALEMTRRNPSILSFNSKNFQPSLEKFSETFGEEEARAMMLRNPNLLAVPPVGYNSAEEAGKETLYMSYVVGATRPLGPLLLFILFSCLATPLIEGLTGVPIRSILFSN